MRRDPTSPGSRRAHPPPRSGEEGAPIYAALRMIFASVFGRDDIVLMPELRAKDVAGWDSFKQIEIIIAAEQRFGFKFASAEIDGLRTLGDLVAIVAARRHGDPSAAQRTTTLAPSVTRE